MTRTYKTTRAIVRGIFWTGLAAAPLVLTGALNAALGVDPRFW